MIKTFFLVPLMALLLILGLSSCVDGTNVYVFGDSLVVNSTEALKAQAPGVTVNAYPGTDTCDWKNRMKAVADLHPRVVIASFVGNGSSCGALNSTTYNNNTFLSVYDISGYYASRHVPLYWAAYPVKGTPTIYGQDWGKIQGNYKYAASHFPAYVHWFDAGLTVAPNHVYTCCINGKTVRQSDKLHLTPDGANLYATELLKPAIS